MMVGSEVKAAVVTLEQLGGAGRLRAMIGAGSFTWSEGGAKLGFIFKGSRKANYVSITLNGLDLYDVEFMKLGKASVSKVAKFEGVYAEDLKSVFEDFTGLYLSL